MDVPEKKGPEIRNDAKAKINGNACTDHTTL